ncbi:GspH/FimT family protein [Methylocaldum szegediense]|nr:GspH/FimT family protein [Methylocaldum szegediense]
MRPSVRATTHRVRPSQARIRGGSAGTRRQDGFTLLEMLLALAVAAALTAIAVPNLTPLLNRAQLTAAARDIASGLRYARGQALAGAREAIFELDVNRKAYRVSGRQKPFSLPDGVRLSLYTAEQEAGEDGIGSIRFFPDGSSTGGRVTLEAAGKKRLVDVNWLTGEVVIRED